jgi:retinol dehydrogenase 14
MNGKTVLVTGGTGGIGRATASGLARMGAHVVIVGRSRERGEAALRELRAEGGKVDLLFADLSSQQSICQLAEEFTAKYTRLDVLVNNVGGLYMKRWETEDGIEATFAMNFLNVFLLTDLLLPLLKRSAPSRIINVNSSAHRFGQINLDDLQAKTQYKGMIAYANTKFMNVLYTYELSRRLTGTGVTANLADPGSAETEMTRGMTAKGMPLFMKPILPLMPIFQRLTMGKDAVNTAAKNSIYLASAPELEGVTSKYMTPNLKIVKSSKASYDERAGRRVWEIAETMLKREAMRV